MFPERIVGACLVLALLLAPGVADAQCRSVCMPDEQRDTSGCCAAAAPSGGGSGVVDQTVGCPPGQTRGPQTQGACCWSGQAFGNGTCRGVPNACPDGHRVQGERCEPLPCEIGRIRARDGVLCCWPGQAPAGGQCRGIPSECPANFDPVGETCSDERYRREVAAHQAAEQAQRDQEQAEIARQQAAERAAQEAANRQAAESERLRQEQANRERAMSEARDPSFFQGYEGWLLGVSLQVGVPGVIDDTFLYLLPGLQFLFTGLGPIEGILEASYVSNPDSDLSAAGVYGALGINVLSMGRADRSIVSPLNLSLGVSFNAWVGDGVPSDATIFMSAYLANTFLFDCQFGARVEWVQPFLGAHGPIAPAVKFSFFFLGERTVYDPDGSC